MALAGGERKLALARALGAKVALDYTLPGWIETVREEVPGVDVVFDGVGGDIGRAVFGLVRPAGGFAATAWPAGASPNLRGGGEATEGGSAPWSSSESR